MFLDGLCSRAFSDVVVDVDNHITPWSTAVSQLWPSPGGSAPTKRRDDGSLSQPASCYGGSGFFKEQIGALLQPSDNRLATKLFGNSRALTKEKLRQKATGRWIVHPCSNFR